LGHNILATGDNKEAAVISGINTQRVIIAAYTLAEGLAVFTGLIMADQLSATPVGMGSGMIFMAFATSLLGGVSLSGDKDSKEALLKARFDRLF